MSELAARDEGTRPRTAGGFAVAAFTGRPAVHALLSEMSRQSQTAIEITLLPLDSHVAEMATEVVARANVAVVDGSIDRAEAIAVSEALRATRPALPIAAVFCCPHSATAADLRGLLAAGVEGLLDLQLSPADTLRVLRGVARGQGAFHLQMAAGSSTPLVELLASQSGADELSDHDLGLLRLVAAGLTDHEIGRQLYLSHHTVKHRIDRLRQRVHARNRIQLAAWAGSHEALRVAREGPAGPSLPQAGRISAEG